MTGGDIVPLVITVQYSCVLCGTQDAPVRVRARASDEDLKTWMDMTIMAVSDDHNRRSPHCHPKTLSNLKIPVEGAEWVGGPAVH
jgi:hypothetical protein